MLKSWKFQILHAHMDNALIVYCWFVVPTRVSQTNWSTLHTWLTKLKNNCWMSTILACCLTNLLFFYYSLIFYIPAHTKDWTNKFQQ